MPLSQFIGFYCWMSSYSQQPLTKAIIYSKVDMYSGVYINSYNSAVILPVIIIATAQTFTELSVYYFTMLECRTRTYLSCYCYAVKYALLGWKKPGQNTRKCCRILTLTNLLFLSRFKATVQNFTCYIHLKCIIICYFSWYRVILTRGQAGRYVYIIRSLQLVRQW